MIRTKAPALAVLFLAALGCGRSEEPSRATKDTAVTTHANKGAVEADQAAGASFVVAPHDGIRWMTAPDGIRDVATAVRDASTRERGEGRTLLVYVGATWCEPCQRFHHAVEQGELDSAFPRLSVLAFDTDRDGEALATAGYVSRLIPLFAVPGADGRASGHQIEGSVKGASAVQEITPRLRALLGS